MKKIEWNKKETKSNSAFFSKCQPWGSYYKTLTELISFFTEQFFPLQILRVVSTKDTEKWKFPLIFLHMETVKFYSTDPRSLSVKREVKSKMLRIFSLDFVQIVVIWLENLKIAPSRSYQKSFILLSRMKIMVIVMLWEKTGNDCARNISYFSEKFC